MSVILVLIPLSLLVALVFLGGFIWAVRSGQYDDTCTPSMRVLTEDSQTKPPHPPIPKPESIEQR